MFTGLIEEVGRVVSVDGGHLVVRASRVRDGLAVGDSLAHNGCCLTVADLGPGCYGVDVVAETLARTNLAALRPGDEVNLERPVRLMDRLGGHIVQGHVDGVGEVVAGPPDLEVMVGASLSRYLVAKGSVAVDGVSLTVVGVGDGRFSVAVVPHTATATTLGRKGPGDTVNVEVDVLAKYVERLLDKRGEP